MSTIEEQLELEKRMVISGIYRYKNNVLSAEENDRVADTKYAQQLLQAFLEPVAQSIKDFNESKTACRAAKYKMLLRKTDPYKVAYFGLRSILNHFTKEEPLASLGIKIGTMIEDELKFAKFNDEQGDYYKSIIKDFKRKGTKSYRHMHRVLTIKANEHGILWNKWGTADKCAIGIKVIDLILESTDLIEKSTGLRKQRYKKPVAIIKPTKACLDWIEKFNEYTEILNPDKLPCVIPPDDWEDIHNGGYYSPEVRVRTPLVKYKNKEHQKLLEAADLSVVKDSINALQRTPWRINTKVLDVLQMAWSKSLEIGLPKSEPYIIPECPLSKTLSKVDMTPDEMNLFMNWKTEARIIHTSERERVSKCFQVTRVLRLANEFKNIDRFWYVYQTDFRGRIYCTVTGLSPQGTDFSKGVLQFADGMKLGKQGELWFKIHGANMFGQDKLPYMERVKWVDDNKEMLISIANDPEGTTEYWANADKPWQFLAFCFEYNEYTTQGQEYISHIRVALDGSCNGLQNFSAMLRDEVGGTATNLIPCDTPADIYSEVSRVCTEKLRRIPSEEAKTWLRIADANNGVLPRGVSKRPVMTLPYGSTRQSCREYIYKYLIEDAPDACNPDDRFKLSLFLTPVLWSSIGEVVIAARAAMDWIQVCASLISKENKGLLWTPPNNFPVYQDRKKAKSRQVHTELAGHFRLRLDQDTDEIDVRKQKLGSSPNFIHSMDACHLMLTVNKAVFNDIDSFACIHDDYGTHAANTPKLHSCIREAFLDLYENNDPLQEFKTTNEERAGITLPDMPDKGSLDLTQILNAMYFFG